MRFAYIDSQGNEVPIPGVDALALRIELGAIGPDTELYDSAADRWGPAHTHEIFQSLSRGSGEEGFVAPPPMVPPPPPPQDPPAADDAATAGPDAPASSPAAPDVPAADSTDDAEDEDLGLDFSLVEGFGSLDESAATDDDPSALAEPGPDDVPDLDLGAPLSFGHPDADADPDFTMAATPVAPDASGPDTPAAPDASDPDTPADDPFDFGGLGSFELEETAETDTESSVAESDLEGGRDVEMGFGPPAGVESPAEPAFGGGMELEQPLSDSMDFEGIGDSGMELEQPLSEFSGEAPPAWMEPDLPAPMDDPDSAGTNATGGSGMADGDPEDGFSVAPTPGRPKREPRNRPSPPKRPRQMNFAGPLVGLLILGVLGAGGWFGWQWLQNSADAREEAAVALPPVTLPDIPPDLMPRMRELGERALAAASAELQDMAAQADLPAEPRNDWLAGVYLANASDFPDIEAYWMALETFVDRVRDVDTEVFHDRYGAELQVAGIEGDTATMLLERADSGFLATREARWAAYAQMEDLSAAALALHDFLEDNQDEISYSPAAGGISVDPVLEAVPASRELGDEMWARVDRITGALDALGSLDRVTTDRLLAVLFDRFRAAGFR